MDTASGATNYIAPPPEWVAELMDSLVAEIDGWLRVDPPEIAAAKVHFGLISIHPLADGNGRTARLAADLILSLTGHSADGMLSVSGVLLERRMEYYAALRGSQGPEYADEVDVTDFVRFHTESLAEAVARLERQAAALEQRRRALAQRFSSLTSPRRVVGLLYLFDIGPLATSAWSRFTGCSQPTALVDLKDLVDEGIVERIGRGPGTRYQLTETTRAALAAASVYSASRPLGC